MNKKQLRVLIVEDNPADAELLELELLNGGYVPSTLRVQTAPAMQAALDSQEWDLILSDYAMPRFSGLQALELNNPLTVIMHQATILERALRDDPRQARVNTILQAVGNCSRIVKNFLALARHEPPRRVPVSVNDVVHAAIDLVAYGLRNDNI